MGQEEVRTFEHTKLIIPRFLFKVYSMSIYILFRTLWFYSWFILSFLRSRPTVISIKTHVSEVWSSQYIFQFKQLERRSLKKTIRASTEFEPMTSVIAVRCSTNWAMKPHIGSKVNLLSSYFPVQVMGSNPIEALFFFFFRLLLSNCLNWKIYCDDHTSLSSTTAVQIWIISYIFHMISLHGKIWTQ